MDTSQYMSMFLEESMDNLQILNDSLLKLEQDPQDTNKLNAIFRVAHTLKGMSATMGFNRISDLTHKMEDVITKFKDGELRVDEKVVTVLFTCFDTLEDMINNIAEYGYENIPIDKIIYALENLLECNEKLEVKKQPICIKEISKDCSKDYIKLKLNEYDIKIIKQAKKNAYNVYEIYVLLNENTLLKAARAFLVFTSLDKHGEIIKSKPTLEDIKNENINLNISLIYITKKTKKEIYDIIFNISEIEKVLVKEMDFQEKSRENDDNHKKHHQFVKVDLERLDKFMNMVSELVMHRNKLEQIGEEFKIPELNETLQQMSRTTSNLQDLVMKIRMLPLEIIFSRFPRMIRDLSVKLGKDMELIIQGEKTQLDRTVIDEIGEPLIHLLRNAADHGIESKEERIKKGKDPVGNIKLIAYQQGNKAIIKVSDDGRGIDFEKIRNKAEKLGINTKGMSERDIKNLIFNQGFSTNEKITDVSGRGVGMDVVKSKISSLGGTLDLISKIDNGTTFIITLPLTLQIIQALLVKIGKETMAISLGYIDRIIDYHESLIRKSNDSEFILYKNNVIPLIRVNEKLGIPYKDISKKYVIIVKVGRKVAGLLVDDLLRQQEIVIKPLGKTLQSLNEYIGATILGGKVTLILDVSSLI